MPNNNNDATAVRPDVVQWYNKETDRYVKFERATGEVLSEKVTAGPYKNIHIAKRRPHKRTPKPAKKAAPTKNAKQTEAKPKKQRKLNYLNNRDLLAEIAKSKAQKPPQMTNKLAHMLQTLAARYGSKGNFAGYTYNEDMQAYAMMMLVRTWDRFDETKSQNPFAFFTQCIKNSFFQYLNGESRHRDIRDKMLVENGLDPSYAYQEAYAQQMAEEREARDEYESELTD